MATAVAVLDMAMIYSSDMGTHNPVTHDEETAGRIALVAFTHTYTHMRMHRTHKEIFWLDVAVHDIEGVAVLQHGCHCMDHHSGLLLTEPLLAAGDALRACQTPHKQAVRHNTGRKMIVGRVGTNTQSS